MRQELRIFNINSAIRHLYVEAGTELSIIWKTAIISEGFQ